MSDLRAYTYATLGIRNNNPGNIRYDGTQWQGAIGQNSGFVVFSTVEYGIRAMAKVIKNNINAGRNTITSYITRYAPPSENDTTAYINNVANYSGISATQKLTPDSNTLFNLVKAQIRVEDGTYSYLVTDDMIRNGIALASGGSITPIVAAGGAGILVILILIGIIYLSNK